jgi:hypothetical protein
LKYSYANGIVHNICDRVIILKIVFLSIFSYFIRVKSEDRITTNQLLAKIGDTGKTDEPHLHIHAQRLGSRKDLFETDPLLMLFGDRFLVRHQSTLTTFSSFLSSVWIQLTRQSRRYANESYTMIFLRSIAIWTIFIIIESLNGTIRKLWLVPLWGDLRAHQISFITGSLLILTIATIFVPWLKISSLSQSIGVGVFWMLLTVVFEVGLGRLRFGYSWAQIAADYNLLQGRLMSLGLVLLILAPLLATKIRGVSQG